MPQRRLRARPRALRAGAGRKGGAYARAARTSRVVGGTFGSGVRLDSTAHFTANGTVKPGGW
jgi:hypothetical protein